MLKNKNGLINKVSSDIISVLCDHYIFFNVHHCDGLFLRLSLQFNYLSFYDAQLIFPPTLVDIIMLNCYDNIILILG